MARQYNISQIESYETDNSGYIKVEFRVRGDNKNTLRIIESNNYVDWVESLEPNRGYNNDNWVSEFYDEYSQNYNSFDFDDWKDENEDESMIKKFIYENFNLNDLPEAE